jgi:hypothetical protein
MSDDFSYKAGTDAAGANLYGGDAAVFYGSDLLKIGTPYSTGLVVGVADIVTEAGAFSANFTFS